MLQILVLRIHRVINLETAAALRQSSVDMNVTLEVTGVMSRSAIAGASAVDAVVGGTAISISEGTVVGSGPRGCEITTALLDSQDVTLAQLKKAAA